jgi:prephenate dehydrogenase
VTRVAGPVRIVGAGLLGTSLGLALQKSGVEVIITDASRANQALAIDYGAGREARTEDAPALVVVCVPPDITASVVATELKNHPNAIVTDVASIKLQVLEDLKALAASDSQIDLSRYVGSHPMAGRERGGAISGRADLFTGRPWVVVANPSSQPRATDAVTDLALEVGSVPVAMEPIEHDHAVAAVSHVPQVVSSLLAARLLSTSAQEISLAGQGLRDTTRIAASDPSLWVQILSANASQVAPVLRDLQADLAQLISALDNPTASGALSTISRTIEAGNRGVERIPGKHGGGYTNYATMVVMIDDRPGQLAQLLAEVAQIDVNLEEIKLEHSPGAQIGLVELSVLPENESRLAHELTARGWRLA